MGQGQGTVSPVPLPWGAAGGAELHAWLQQSPCLSPAPWGCVAAPCLQQGVEVHSPDREGPCASLPPPAPVPVTGAAVSLQSRMCKRSATKSTPQSTEQHQGPAGNSPCHCSGSLLASEQAGMLPQPRGSSSLSFLCAKNKCFSLSLCLYRAWGGDSGHEGEGQ